jgi:hypothetical protein
MRIDVILTHRQEPNSACLSSSTRTCTSTHPEAHTSTAMDKMDAQGKENGEGESLATAFQKTHPPSRR